MNRRKEKILLGKRQKLLDELRSLPDWIDGSIVETTRVQSGKEQAFNYLSRSKGGRNRTTYIAGKRLEAFKKARLDGEQAKRIFNEIVEINIQLLKKGGNDVEK